jgi:hypothetical protein
MRPPNFSGQSFFYLAGVVLCCRIFGRLATVHLSICIAIFVILLLLLIPILRYEKSASSLALAPTESARSLVTENLSQIFNVKGTVWMVGKQLTY